MSSSQQQAKEVAWQQPRRELESGFLSSQALEMTAAQANTWFEKMWKTQLNMAVFKQLFILSH